MNQIEIDEVSSGHTKKDSDYYDTLSFASHITFSVILQQ